MEESPAPEQTPKQSKIILVVIIIVAVIAVAGVAIMILANPSKAPSATQNQATSSNSDAATNDTNTDTATATATITFTNTGFSPATLTVKKGTKVTVVNNSNDPVQFSSDDHPTHRLDPEINMDELAPGESGSFTVSTVGTHGFHDHVDDSKTGTLIVTE